MLTGKWSFIPVNASLYVSPKKPRPSPTIYDIHGHKLELVDSAKYLGVTIQKPSTGTPISKTLVKSSDGNRSHFQDRRLLVTHRSWHLLG
jgi:hypothetical protein